MKAKCVNGNNCKNLKVKEGFYYFTYKYDFGMGRLIYYGRATSVSRMKEGRNYNILITKDYNERVIIYADVQKLLIGMIMLSLLLLFLYIS